MVKIKIDCWWTSSENITRRVISQFCFNKKIIDGIKFVYEDDYDYLIILGRPKGTTKLKDKGRTFCFTMEPLWSENNTKNLHEISNKIIVHDKRGYLDVPNYEESLVYMLYGGHGELDFNQKEFEWTYENMRKKDFIKNKKISYIVRNSYETHLIKKEELYDVIYEDRVKIAELILKNDIDVDIYGKNWVVDNTKIKGEIWNKMIGLNNYKFSISAENTIQKNYITEKFWDCIITNTIPIYFGANNFNELIPELNFFDLTKSIRDEEEIKNKLKYILANSDELYENYLPIILKLKEKYFNNSSFNIILKIKELISI